MNEQYIRKAVELLEEWSIVHIYDGEDWAQLFEDNTGVPTQQILLQDPHKFQGSLDALAAHLVRRVDELGDVGLVIYPDFSGIETNGCDSIVDSGGRTTNTIMVIVDSEVLA